MKIMFRFITKRFNHTINESIPKDIRSHHHSRPSTIRCIIHALIVGFRKVSNIDKVNFELKIPVSPLSTKSTTSYAAFDERLKVFRKDGENENALDHSEYSGIIITISLFSSSISGKKFSTKGRVIISPDLSLTSRSSWAPLSSTLVTSPMSSFFSLITSKPGRSKK